MGLNKTLSQFMDCLPFPYAKYTLNNDHKYSTYTNIDNISHNIEIIGHKLM